MFFSLALHYASVMTDPPFMRKIEFMKKTMGLTYILEHAYKRGGGAEAETETERKGMKGGEKREEKKGRKVRGEGERWVGQTDWLLCTGRLCNVK